MEELKARKKFSDLLREKNPTLHACWEHIKEKGLEEWVPLLTFDSGSHSGYPHLLNVEQNANKMVPDAVKDGFSSGELFLLLSAIFLHDIGRIEVRKKKGKKSKGKDDHNAKSRKLISQYWAELGFPDERIAKYCGIICDYHCSDEPFAPHKDIRYFQNTSLEPYGLLRIPLLSAILRFADEAENCWKRSLQDYLYQQIQKTHIPLFKGVRRFIEDVEFCQQGECIILHIPADFFSEETRDSQAKSITIKGNNNHEIDTLDSLNRMIAKLRLVITSSWKDILAMEAIKYNAVYFEHQSQLLSKLEMNRNHKIENEKLGEIIVCEDDSRASLQDLYNSIIKLYMGSLNHRSFTWNVIEAEIGKTIGDREKWLLGRMNAVDQNRFFVSLSPERVHIIQLDLANIKKLQNLFGFKIKE